MHVRVPVTTARGCPDESCTSAGELRAGEQLRLQEVAGEWARCTAASGLLAAWVPLDALAAGAPELLEAARDVKLFACGEPGCAEVGVLKAGDQVLLADASAAAILVGSPRIVGFARERDALRPVAPARPPALPPATPAPYLPPLEPPRYLPPAEPPRYVPSTAPPVYVPPARPAARRDEPVEEGTLHVRRASVQVREEPRADAKGIGAPLPGGAKLYAGRRSDGWVEVGTSPPRVGPAMGWVPATDLRELPPLVYGVGGDRLSYRPCLQEKEASCAPRTLEQTPESVVAIDESDDGSRKLCILAGAPGGYGWVEASALEK